MAFSVVSPELGIQRLTETSTVQNHPLGTVEKFTDPVTYGTIEAIYLKGVASTAVGDTVIYDTKLATTTRTVAGSRGPVGVAMSANVASQWGWYAILGSVPVTCGTVAANTPLFATATPGSVDDAVVATDKIDGLIAKSANGTPSAGLLVAQLARPSMNGNG